MIQESILDSVTINFSKSELWIMNIALSFVMFGVALEIVREDFERLIKRPKPVFVGFLSQFVALPFMSYLLVISMQPSASITLGVFMVAACPGGNISNFITYLSRGNTALSVSLTAIATLLAVFLTPLNFYLWASLYEPTSTVLQTVSISFWELAKLVFLLLGVPLILGMWVRAKYPVFAATTSKYFKVLSILFFLVLIVVALYKNADYIDKYLSYVFVLVLLHNLIAFLTGFSLSTLFKLSWNDKKSITVETGIQNSGLGLMLIFTFFNGLGGMAIVTAFWGIWHMISGAILATVFSKIKNKS